MINVEYVAHIGIVLSKILDIPISLLSYLFEMAVSFVSKNFTTPSYCVLNCTNFSLKHYFELANAWLTYNNSNCCYFVICNWK